MSGEETNEHIRVGNSLILSYNGTFLIQRYHEGNIEIPVTSAFASYTNLFFSSFLHSCIIFFLLMHCSPLLISEFTFNFFIDSLCI
jgi:hypothetical protein